jgi:pyridoxal phosphate enzyme (YggS family)
MTTAAEGLNRVWEAIARAADRAGRDPHSVTLVAITKAVSADRIREAIDAGHLDFGENRAQEAVAKYKEVAHPGVRWHFVGRLQRNKVRQLVDFIHLIHSVDRVEVAEEINRRAPVPMEVLIEVKVSEEATKGGVSPPQLRPLIEAAADMPRLKVSGLMTMAPLVRSPDEARPYFRRLAELRAEMEQIFPELGIRHLSMGMSQDYEVAVEEGSTILRIGEAIFGPRPHAATRR